MNLGRLACKNCTRLKVKCDKGSPCSRCTRTGHECHPREALNTRRRPVRRQSHTLQVNQDAERTPEDGLLRPSASVSGQGRERLPVSAYELTQDVTLGQQLVNFHIRHLAWYHNVLHAPTFLEDCEAYWTESYVRQPLWMALYLAILSTSAWTLENSTIYRQSLRIDSAILVGLAEKYYNAMIESLYAADFATNHSTYSIQAVLVSTMVAHCLGRSDQLYTMLFSCTRIAQCLGLHKIAVKEPDSNMDLNQWTVAMDREVGKRIYWKLVECDYYAIPYTNTYGMECAEWKRNENQQADRQLPGINLAHITTPMPLNCDDHDLEDRDSTVVTVSTYTNVMIKSTLQSSSPVGPLI